MKKYVLLITTFLLCLIMPLMLLGCSKKETYELPSHYYNLSSNYIGYTYNNSVYNKDTKHFLAKFDYDKKIFIDKYGNYYAEIIEGDILVYNKNSKYVNVKFEIPSYKEIGNIPSIPKIRGYIAFQPSYIIDVVLYN